jgi:hypothetical protein
MCIRLRLVGCLRFGVSEESQGFVGASVCAREALVECWSYGINSALGWL